METYQESNTRFLLINNNWHGLIIDGSDVNIEYIKKDSIYWRHNLTALSSFITAENINQIFVDSGFRDRVGLLSIDIDGNDYWVWKAITAIEPSIVVVEYNSLFGNDRAITVPYRPDFNRRTAHYSNLFLGASLPALYDLAVEKGYAFAGCNRAGNNAYFIRNEFTEFFKSKTLSEGYVQAQFRESLTESGELSFLSFDECKKLIRNLLVFNVKTQEEEPF